MNYSKQRDEIKSFLMKRKDHPTAEVVHRHVQKIIPKISLATVYRNLRQLSDIGEIQMIDVGDGQFHFDGDVSPHDHFICRCCGAVYDLKRDEVLIQRTVEAANSSFAGTVESAVIYFTGVCSACAEKKEGNTVSVS